MSYSYPLAPEKVPFAPFLMNLSRKLASAFILLFFALMALSPVQWSFPTQAHAGTAANFPPGTQEIVLECYAKRRGNDPDSTWGAPHHRPESHCAKIWEAPETGSPWAVLIQDVRITSRNQEDVTQYSFHITPSTQNVKKIELSAHANYSNGFRGLFINPPSSWIGVRAFIRLAPHADTLPSFYQEIATAMNHEHKQRILKGQRDELSQRLHDIDEAEPELRGQIITKTNQIIDLFNQNQLDLTQAVAALSREQQRYERGMKRARFHLLDLQHHWNDPINKSLHEDLRRLQITPVDPQAQLLLDDRLEYLSELQSAMSQDIQSAMLELAPAGLQRTSPPLIALNPLNSSDFATVCFFQSNPFVGCLEIYRFMGDQYCKESAPPTHTHLQMVVDYDQWRNLFHEKKYTGECKPFRLLEDPNEPEELEQTPPPLMPSPLLTQTLPELHQSAATEALEASAVAPEQAVSLRVPIYKTEGGRRVLNHYEYRRQISNPILRTLPKKAAQPNHRNPKTQQQTRILPFIPLTSGSLQAPNGLESSGTEPSFFPRNSEPTQDGFEFNASFLPEPPILPLLPLGISPMHSNPGEVDDISRLLSQGSFFK
ncbi:MAG: hypothetical protein ACO3A2_02995 [Bdellovibrionia bacterium]